MTRFSTGVIDSLFGEKLVIELPSPDGGVIKRKVTRKWLEAMQRRGQAREISHPPEGLASSEEELLGKAQRLVAAAKINALAISTPSESAFLAQYPFLKEPILRASERWDLLATAAGVCCGILSLGLLARSEGLPADQHKFLMKTVYEDFSKRFGQEFEGLLPDCAKFINNSTVGSMTEKEVESTTLISAGIWVLWNLLDRKPLNEESEAATALGVLLGTDFLRWWSSPQ